MASLNSENVLRSSLKRPTKTVDGQRHVRFACQTPTREKQKSSVVLDKDSKNVEESTTSPRKRISTSQVSEQECKKNRMSEAIVRFFKAEESHVQAMSKYSFLRMKFTDLSRQMLNLLRNLQQKSVESIELDIRTSRVMDKIAKLEKFLTEERENTESLNSSLAKLHKYATAISTPSKVLIANVNEYSESESFIEQLMLLVHEIDLAKKTVDDVSSC
ncbi:hypothetical protein AB6A40_001608 [Gnathostoma spinigerum]|uniref:Uncharacterized protein n=1 Tax=Gnathostoma spinigerum TaxID=75299 RepID=A0ABD6EC29_9BILA